MGYDFVSRLMQINFGVRVAEVRAKATATTNASAAATRVLQLNPLAFVDTDTSVATASDVTSVRRSFFGAGPRVGLEGSVPLIGPLGFDYSTNAALLFGTTKITSASNSALSNSSTDTAVAGGVVLFTETVPPTQTSLSNGTKRSSSVAVYNFDIQGGFSWWFSPTLKLGLSYRLDAFHRPAAGCPGRRPPFPLLSWAQAHIDRQVLTQSDFGNWKDLMGHPRRLRHGGGLAQLLRSYSPPHPAAPMDLLPDNGGPGR